MGGFVLTEPVKWINYKIFYLVQYCGQLSKEDNMIEKGNTTTSIESGYLVPGIPVW
jgi:hypothetical protein